MHGLARSDQQRLCLDPIHPIPFCRGDSPCWCTLGTAIPWSGFSDYNQLVQLCLIPWTAAHWASWPSLALGVCSKFMSMNFRSMMPSNHLILCHPLLPSVFTSITVFSKKLAICIRWPKYWSFSFGISPSSEYSGLISFRIDWFDLLAVQGTLKSLLQHC